MDFHSSGENRSCPPQEKIPTVLFIKVGETIVLSKPAMKCLGMMMSVFEQLISIDGGPLSSRYRLMSVLQFDLLSCPEILPDSLSTEMYPKSE